MNKKYDLSDVIEVKPPSLADESAHWEYFANNKQAPPVAVLVFHGIGEEVKFGTLSSAALLLLTRAKELGAAEISVVIRPVPKDATSTDLVIRAELAWTEKDGKKRQVHVYESYWAPLTMGKVTYWETIGFLLSAGWNGVKGTIVAGQGLRFSRWLFGGFRGQKITFWTLPLLITLILLVLFITLAIAMTVTAAAGVAQRLSAHGNTIANVKDALSFLYKQVANPWDWIVTHIHLPHGLLFDPELSRQHWGQAVLAILIWGLGVAGAYWFQRILTVYVGSLVAYLSPYKDSKWEELRNDIQQRGLDIAKVVYDGHTQPSGWIPKYDRIVILGHSLGSVIAYDTLNAMINIQASKLPAGAANPVVERTRSLITFGSPLDKTAFLFRTQLNARYVRQNTVGFLRETMVGAVQPLITSYPLYRHNPGPPRQGPKWFNIWSPWDIVSGKLDYYDDPNIAPHPDALVQNKIDRQAWIPLVAHLQYWTKELLRKIAYDELFG